MENSVLTLEQAYRAMFYYLENEYELTRSDDIGILLGSMDWTIWEGQSVPADPAVWGDWLSAVSKVINSKL